MPPASVAFVAIALAGARPAAAEVRVAALIGAHMVVQQGRPVRLWGTADPGENVRAGIADKTAQSRADARGYWTATLPPLGAGGPHTLTIQGSNTLTFGDIWVGEVWIASGQSNMDLVLSRATGAAEAVAGGCPALRLFTVPRTTAAVPKTDVEGQWQVCDANTAPAFSAVAFHFGRDVQRALGVPVGLILASRGGTPAEAWTPRSALLADPALRSIADDYEKVASDPTARAEIEHALAAWEARNFHQDRGNTGEARGYASPRSTPKGWSTMNLPRPWENAALPIDGAVWFRREIDVPADWQGQPLALSLGPIDDFDVTYWNGERIGATGSETPEYYAVPRRYTVPARVVRRGRNVIAVRVFDHYGSGGFMGAAAQMNVRPQSGAADALSLAGAWTFKIESRLKPVIADFATRPKIPEASNPESPSVLWNAMIAPVTQVQTAGVIWYQGESNAERAFQYRTLFPAMIRAWRAAWASPELPFLFVQLPNFADGAHPAPLGSGRWAGLREAQAAALKLPKTAMAVTLDIGEAADIHPRNKAEVGRRLALQALRVVYGKDVIASGPVFQSSKREGRTMRIRFGAVTSALSSTDGAAPRGFIIAGGDQIWHQAEARIDGSDVVVACPAVSDPVAVRYGWGDDPDATLRNQADLPAAPFRTDDWPAITGSRAGDE